MSTLRVASIVASLALAGAALAQGASQEHAMRRQPPLAAPPPASTAPASGAAQPAPAVPTAAQPDHGNEKALGKAKSLGRKLFDRGAQLGASKAKPLVGAKAAEKAAKVVTKKGEPHVEDVVENAADFLNAWRGKDAPREGAR